MCNVRLFGYPWLSVVESMVACPNAGGGLAWWRWRSGLVSVAFWPGVRGSLLYGRWRSGLVSAVAPGGMLPPLSQAVPSPSMDGDASGRHSSPRMMMSPPYDVTGAAAAGWFVWPLLECA